jgi:hypothetical protein
MLDRVAPAAAHAAHPEPGPREAGPASKDRPARPFSVILREQPTPPAPTAGGPLGPAATPRAEAAAPSLAVRHMERIVDSHRALERAMGRALRGADFTPAQLLSLQFQVQKYSLEVEAVSRVVDRVTGAVKTAMQTQI